MKRELIPTSDDYWAVLKACGGYYECPKDEQGKRLGPLCCYAGPYTASDGIERKFVGDIYADWAMVEIYPEVLEFLSARLFRRMAGALKRGLDEIDLLIGVPVGGYSVATALSLASRIPAIKAEKLVTRAKTDSEREEAKIIFGRHKHVLKPGQRVVIVEDVTTNFSTTLDLVFRIQELGGIVVAIVCYLNRSVMVGNFYSPGKFTLSSGEAVDWSDMKIPVISLIRKPLPQYKQDDPEVAEDIAGGNIVWNVKQDWARLMQAMAQHPQS